MPPESSNITVYKVSDFYTVLTAETQSGEDVQKQKEAATNPWFKKSKFKIKLISL